MSYDLLLSNSAKNRRRTPVDFGAVLGYLQCKVQAVHCAQLVSSPTTEPLERANVEQRM